MKADFVLVSLVFLFVGIDRIAELLVKIFKFAGIIALEVLTEVVFREIIVQTAHS